MVEGDLFAFNTISTMGRIKVWSKKACDVNFSKTFISSISLFSELAGSNLVQILLNPSKVTWRRLYLLNVFVVFVNARKM